jgi:cytochrome P450
VIANIWYVSLMNSQIAAADFFAKLRSMLRDESLYPEASTFKPERFIAVDPDKRKLMDPRNYVFGFGRR